VKYGLILGSPSIAEQVRTAQRAEAAGFNSVWTIEFFNMHGLVRLAVVAAATERVQLGTAIAYAFMRTPVLAATAAMDIDEISGGRMILGLGSGTERMNRDWYSMPFDDPPAPRIKDAIGLVRAVFDAQSGGGLVYDGPCYQVNNPAFSRPGAVRERIPVAMAAAVTDEMVDEIAIAGTPDKVRDQLGAWEDIADDVFLYSPIRRALVCNRSVCRKTWTPSWIRLPFDHLKKSRRH
jgi:alkanesulfonate monooxygenase SsuD/methylene tetrahydromethanopterin reductase-like flavin-dependent oxidoreductase (luciferase family)|tara:strand:- start:26 stop:733 length:708 start_codon:yes stop_codon:yes gene_type:complete